MSIKPVADENKNNSTKVSHKNEKLSKTNVVRCRYHPEENLIEDHHSGSIICPECGLVVVDRVISEENEWRNFEEDGINRSRVGRAENVLLSSITNLETSISQSPNMNAYGSEIFKRTQRRTIDRALLHAFGIISDMSDRINLPISVTHRAQVIYQQIYKTRKLKGNILATDPKPAACLYIACQQEDCPRTLKEISAISENSVHQINTVRHILQKQLNLTSSKIDSTDLLPRFCGQLNLSSSVQKRASEIAKMYQNEGTNAFPETVAAASIYIAAQSVRQRDIGEAVGITASTISRVSRLVTHKLQK